MHEPPASHPVSDLQLVQRANSGDGAAFAILYDRYIDWAVRVAHRHLHDVEAARDVAHDSFLWLLKQFPGFELRARMKTVLYPVIRNTAIARLRRKGVEARHETRVGMAAVSADQSADVAHPDRLDIAAMLDRLGEAHREILYLRFVDDLDGPEIARALGIPPGTVKSRLHHALKQLRDDPVGRDFFSDLS